MFLGRNEKKHIWKKSAGWQLHNSRKPPQTVGESNVRHFGKKHPLIFQKVRLEQYCFWGRIRGRAHAPQESARPQDLIYRFKMLAVEQKKNAPPPKNRASKINTKIGKSLGENDFEFKSTRSENWSHLYHFNIFFVDKKFPLVNLSTNINYPRGKKVDFLFLMKMCSRSMK